MENEFAAIARFCAAEAFPILRELLGYTDQEQVAYRPRVDVPNALFTQRIHGPVLAITWWRYDCKEPIHMVTQHDLRRRSRDDYQRRFKIETFFSDQKSRGFYLHKSLPSDPGRLSRLMIAICFAA